jgi:hypothetical protein
MFKVFPYMYIIHQLYMILNMQATLQENTANMSVMFNPIWYYKYVTLKKGHYTIYTKSKE